MNKNFYKEKIHYINISMLPSDPKGSLDDSILLRGVKC